MWHSQFKRPTECAHHKRRLRKTWTGCNQGAGKCASCNAASRAAEGLGTCGCRPMRARTGPWRRRLGGRSEAHWPGQRRTHRTTTKVFSQSSGGRAGRETAPVTLERRVTAIAGSSSGVSACAWASASDCMATRTRERELNGRGGASRVLSQKHRCHFWGRPRRHCRSCLPQLRMSHIQ